MRTILLQAAEAYAKDNLSVIVTQKDKRPLGAWKGYQSIKITEEELDKKLQHPDAYGIGIVCGKISNNTEVLDIDLKHDLSGNLGSELRSMIEDNAPGLLPKMRVHETPSGGYHFLYRCETIEGNQVLAKNANGETLIETRGEDGQVVAYPTTGYIKLDGYSDAIQTITIEERNILFDIARSFNQKVESKLSAVVDKNTDQDLPGNDFNKRGDILKTFQDAGWKLVREDSERIYFLRPGYSTATTSGDYHKGHKLFKAWSSSTEFEPGRGYSLFSVYAILNHKGDFKAAAKQLASDGYGKQSVKAKVLPMPTKNEGTVIAKLAHTHKEMGMSVEQSISTIEKYGGVERSKSEYIVNKIFDAAVVEGEKISKIDIAQNCISEFGTISRNAITDEVELNGKPIEDSDVNEIFRLAAPKYSFITTELLWKIIESHYPVKVDPFKEFFEKYKDRKPTGVIREYFSCLGNDEYIQQMGRVWLIGLIASMNGNFSDLMLILCGEPNTGKTFFFKHLLPKELENYFMIVRLGDIKNDILKRDLDIRMSTTLLICDDELAGKDKRDEKFIKQILSVEYTKVRASGARKDKIRKRIATFCGTSNSSDILTDPTGNRRMLPYLLKAPIDREKINKIDRIDLLMEAYWAFKNGEKWNLEDADIKLLNDNTKEFEFVSTEHELLLKHFEIDQSLVNGDLSGSYDFTEILKHLEDYCRPTMINQKVLRDAIKKIGLTSKPGSVEGKKARFYRVKKICRCGEFFQQAPQPYEPAPF
jgi:hypothetical protein